MNKDEQIYICPECGKEMEVEEEELICPECGYSVYIEDYGFSDDDTYYDTVFAMEYYTGKCDNFPEEFPPVCEDDDEEE